MTATLVIINYNGRELLARSVPAALAARGDDCQEGRRSSGSAAQVIVADDGSTDDSVEYLIYEHPEVKVLPFRHRGFVRTCNAAVEAAESDVVVLLNSDVVVFSDFLAPLLADLQEPDVFAVGCRFLNPDGSLTDALGNRTSGEWRRGLLHIHHETDPAKLAEICPQLYANGGAMGFWREKWQALGGFDDLYHPFYWEDVDIGYRAWGRGWRVLYEPASMVYHDQGGTIGKLFRPRHIELISARNAVLFAWKNLLDPRLFRRLLAGQTRWAADDVLIAGLPPRTRALWAALGRLRAAARRRAQEQRARVISDSAILTRARGEAW